MDTNNNQIIKEPNQPNEVTGNYFKDQKKILVSLENIVTREIHGLVEIEKERTVLFDDIGLSDIYDGYLHLLQKIKIM